MSSAWRLIDDAIRLGATRPLTPQRFDQHFANRTQRVVEAFSFFIGKCVTDEGQDLEQKHIP